MVKNNRWPIIIATLVMIMMPIFAVGTQDEDPLYNFAKGVGEIVQINLSLWRIFYVIFEITALIFAVIVLPVIVFKVGKWAIKEGFK